MQPLYDDPHDLYEQAFAKYSELQEGSADASWESIEATIELFSRCRAATSRECLFSKDDKADDVHTNVIKFLYLDFYIAKLHSQHQSLRTRYHHLRQAVALFKRFLGRCADMDAMQRDDLVYYERLVDGDDGGREGASRALSSSISAADRRTMKISKFKREKEANQRIAHLTGIISAHRSNKNYNDSSDTIAADKGRDLEEEQREVYLLQLHNHIRSSIDDVSTLSEEIGLLEHMTDLRELYDDGDGAVASSSAMPSSVRSDNAAFLPGRRSQPLAPGEGPPIEITRTSNVDGQLVMQREYIKASVFTPRMAGPTMTLEEFADLELADAKRREQSTQQGPGEDPNPGPRKYKQLEADGDEDNQGLVDAATAEDREWDRFKEANPRGWGNKMGKRC